MKYITILLILATMQLQSQVTIGWDASCDYDVNIDATALQQAIDDGHTDIRLTNENEYLHSISIRNQTQIRGGYNSCQDATNGIQTNLNSVINAALDSGFSTIFVFDIEDADILLDSLTITNGSDSGLYITKLDGLVTLNHIKIDSNTGSTGGLYVFNSHTLANPDALIIDIKDSVVSQNNASGSGGGIGCIRTSGNVGVSLTLSQGSVIHNNHADSKGGGIYTDGCTIDLSAGQSTQVNNAEREIFGNTSNGSGGGISVQDAVVNIAGDFDQSFDINNNQTGLSGQTNTSGGGIWAVGSSDITLTNAHVVSNKSQKYGAGLYTSIGSVITMDMASGGCGYSEFCSSLKSNQLFANGGGAAFAATGGELEINRTHIALNNGNSFGYVGYLENDAVVKLEGNLMLSNGIQQGFANDNGMYLRDTASLSLYYNTLDLNSILVSLIRADDNSQINMIGNIIDESADILLSAVNVGTNINCNMLSQTNNITASMIDTIIDSALFVNPGVFGDYQLDESSTNAMDVCSFVTYLPGDDLSNRQRGFDNEDVPDGNGFYDLGAYEFILVIDNIFSNSFE